MQKTKYIIIEHMPDCAWEWWAVMKNKTPEQGVQAYLDDMGYDKDDRKTKIEKDGVYGVSADVRAYEISIL